MLDTERLSCNWCDEPSRYITGHIDSDRHYQACSDCRKYWESKGLIFILPKLKLGFDDFDKKEQYHV